MIGKIVPGHGMRGKGVNRDGERVGAWSDQQPEHLTEEQRERIIEILEGGGGSGGQVDGRDARPEAMAMSVDPASGVEGELGMGWAGQGVDVQKERMRELEQVEENEKSEDDGDVAVAPEEVVGVDGDLVNENVELEEPEEPPHTHVQNTEKAVVPFEQNAVTLMKEAQQAVDSHNKIGFGIMNMAW